MNGAELAGDGRSQAGGCGDFPNAIGFDGLEGMTGAGLDVSPPCTDVNPIAVNVGFDLCEGLGVVVAGWRRGDRVLTVDPVTIAVAA